MKRIQSDNSAPDQVRVRCLGCGKSFWGKSKFNRTCLECKLLVSWSGEKEDACKAPRPVAPPVKDLLEFEKSKGYMCYAPDCRNQARSKGLCMSHYLLKWRYGSFERPERRNKKDLSKINLFSADLFARHAKKCYDQTIGAERMMYWRSEMRKAERMTSQGAPCHESAGGGL